MNISANLFMTKVQSLKLWALLPQYKRMALPVIVCLLLIQGHTRDITLNVLSDAFWQVAVFVAMSLTIYHLFADKVRNLYTNSKRESKPYKEIITASFMGVLPGCGGAIVVITQYVSGQMGFGSVAAALTSTMGDAAFLLLAAEPLTGTGIVILCFFVGIASGLIVNKIHGPDFLRHTIKTNKKQTDEKKKSQYYSYNFKVSGACVAVDHDPWCHCRTTHGCAGRYCFTI
ncbi:putative manganese transporter [Pseudocolwellia sp. HL-MZ7]|uniref:putative manganese transporter n=1 Tax=Pseudocolwellia sp. HL-MZ7 TaxID=3400627 RepID=UPI003CE9D171